MGGNVVDIIKVNNVYNKLNQTYCFIIEPKKRMNIEYYPKFSVPGKNLILKNKKAYYYSAESGVSFPVIENIPILKSDSRILTTALDF